MDCLFIIYVKKRSRMLFIFICIVNAAMTSAMQSSLCLRIRLVYRRPYASSLTASELLFDNLFYLVMQSCKMNEYVDCENILEHNIHRFEDRQTTWIQ